MTAESDPAQSVDLRLIPEDVDRSEEVIPVPGQKGCFTTARVRFLNRPRGVLETFRRVDEPDREEAAKTLRPHQFDKRLVSLGSLMADIAQTHHLKTGLQPSQSLSRRKTSLIADNRRELLYADSNRSSRGI